jgi:hypothetical protein
MFLDRHFVAAVVFFLAVGLSAGFGADALPGLKKVVRAPSVETSEPVRQGEPVTRARQAIDVPAAVAEMGPRRWRTQVPDSLEQGFQLDRNSPWSSQARLFDPGERDAISRTMLSPAAMKAVQDALRAPPARP